MQKLVFAALIVAAGSFAAAADATVPGSPPAAAPPDHVALVAMNCGAGRARDAHGHCRRRFNLFDQHRSFRAYKDRHCTPVTTPNGRVDRCRI